MEVIKLHKRCNKTKAAVKIGAKVAKKAPKSGYHFFSEREREQLDKMTGEYQKKLWQYCVKNVEGGQRRSYKAFCIQS